GVLRNDYSTEWSKTATEVQPPTYPACTAADINDPVCNDSDIATRYVAKFATKIAAIAQLTKSRRSHHALLLRRGLPRLGRVHAAPRGGEPRARAAQPLHLCGAVGGQDVRPPLFAHAPHGLGA